MHGNFNESVPKSKNQFAQLKGVEEFKTSVKQSKSNKMDQIHKRYDTSMNSSVFLKSILDRTSDIFAIKSRQSRHLEQVRKGYDAKWDPKPTILYDCDQNKAKNKPITPYNSGMSDISMVMINKEIDSYLAKDSTISGLDSKDSSDIISDDMEKPLKFSKQRDSKLSDLTDQSTVPSMPRMSIFMQEGGKLSDKLVQIVTISELNQPDKDEVAERILSTSNEPYHINFDISTSEFNIDYSLIPDDNR